jgi:hypothetical protein
MKYFPFQWNATSISIAERRQLSLLYRLSWNATTLIPSPSSTVVAHIYDVWGQNSKNIRSQENCDKEMEKIPRGASQFMLTDKKCSTHGGNTNRHKMCWEHWRERTTWRTWRRLEDTLKTTPINMLYGAGSGIRRRNFMHTAMGILQSPYGTWNLLNNWVTSGPVLQFW